MNPKSLRRRGVPAASVALLLLCAASATGCSKCSSGTSGASGTGATSSSRARSSALRGEPSACDELPNPPDFRPPDPVTCRYWVVDDPTGACKPIPVGPQPGKSWQGASLFGYEKVPIVGLQKYCNYQWSDPTGNNSTSADAAALPPLRSSPNCTYLTPQQAAPDAFTQWARDELLPPFDERLPPSGDPATVDIKVRVVVLDTAPATLSASPLARHGQTLAQLIRDSACQKSAMNPADCAVEVRSALALPLVMNPVRAGVPGIPRREATGGYFGLLTDVAMAIWNEADGYRDELKNQEESAAIRRTTPARVIFNESFGFGNTDQFPKRCDAAPARGDIAAQALFDTMMASSCLGILHVAAAGNDTGGDKYRDGQLCPARWDKAIVPTDGICERLWGTDAWRGTEDTKETKGVKGLKTRLQEFLTTKVNPKAEREKNDNDKQISPSPFTDAQLTGADSLLSVGGVDYHGSPLVLTRPNACPEAVAIGIGGTSLEGREKAPFFFGTSVSAAVASARLAVQWVKDASPTANAMQLFNPNYKTTSFASETGLCGTSFYCPNALPWIGSPAAPSDGQNHAWPDMPLDELWKPLGTRQEVRMEPVVCLDKLPYCHRQSRASTSDVWPQPTEPVCLKCAIHFSSDPSGDPALLFDPNPRFSFGERDALMVVYDARGAVVLTQTVSHTSFLNPSWTVLAGAPRDIFTNARVVLSGYDSTGTSYSQQIFVDQ